MPPSTLTKFVAASGLVNLADGIAMVAWAWLASLLTRDPLLIAIVTVVLRVPWVLFTIPAGIITDRMDRRKLILRMDVLRGGAFVLLTFVLLWATPLPPPTINGLGQPWLFALILCVAALVGVAEVFRDNAAQTMLPAVVDDWALERANGRLWSVELIGNALLGPALGAVLIAHAVFAPFAVNALAYGVAFVLLVQIRGTFQPPPVTKRDWKAEMREGVHFLRAVPLLMALAWITGFANLFYEMIMIALVLHVQENLRLGAEIYGLILAAGALGGILGGWTGERVVAKLGPLRTVQWMLVLSVPAFVGVVVAPDALSLAVALMLFNFTALVWNTVSVSYRQRMIPDALLGRVNSLFRLFAWGMMPVGIFLSGVIVSIADDIVAREVALMAPFVIGTVGSIVLAVFGWRALARHWP